ncbi:hypothetical protein GCM10022255_107040 [Dactylosporangium darangshiense]|uniref:Uncharacterized protein n=1 Tax=Dactylosporangium darangshiense TaxID=579108 RepID=A0ABP8DTR8_9ACTN
MVRRSDRADALGYRVVTATGSGRFAVEDELRALETLVMIAGGWTGDRQWAAAGRADSALR